MDNYTPPDFMADFGDTAYWSAGLLELKVLDVAAATTKAVRSEDNSVEISVNIRISDDTRLDAETVLNQVESALSWANNKRKANK